MTIKLDNRYSGFAKQTQNNKYFENKLRYRIQTYELTKI